VLAPWGHLGRAWYAETRNESLGWNCGKPSVRCPADFGGVLGPLQLWNVDTVPEESGDDKFDAK
jgi:hypothetical protein